MKIERIIISGFSNIERVDLSLEKFNALVALNNYGKSNVVNAIMFGIDFIIESADVKSKMMAMRPYIPINKFIDETSFHFEVVFSARFEEENFKVNYGFSFDWIRNDDKGKKIKNEFLKLKPERPDSRYKTYIKRTESESLYLSAPTGRCDKKIKIRDNELILNKLANFDDLFYSELIETLNELSIKNVDTLENPDRLFTKIKPNIVRTGYSLDMPDNNDVGFFIFSLKMLKPDLYEVFLDSVKSLLQDVEDFEPIEIDFKKEIKFENEHKNLPLDFPDKLYDIRVKEKNNNQQSGISRLSSGSQKVFYLLALTIAAELNRIPLVFFEELENSIHPGLLQKLLIILDGLTEETRIITTSHSPYLIQYLDTKQVKIGIPNNSGLAQFKEIKPTKFKKVLRMAEDEGISIGDFIFDRVIECSSGDNELLNELCY